MKRLLADCDKGLIDYIIVKSISRFSRNTVDSIEIVRKLYQDGIYIYFEKENIDTGKMEASCCSPFFQVWRKASRDQFQKMAPGAYRSAS